MRIIHSFNSPPQFQERFEDRINGPDGGIINAWLAGIKHRSDNSPWYKAAEAGELPILPYRGGVEKKIKKNLKIGVLHYLAMWQGLRGEDLDINTTDEPILTCSKFGVSVQYTLNLSKIYAQVEE